MKPPFQAALLGLLGFMGLGHMPAAHAFSPQEKLLIKQVSDPQSPEARQWRWLIESDQGQPQLNPKLTANHRFYLSQTFKSGWEVDELELTLADLQNPVVNDQSSRCQHPARYYWLGLKLNHTPYLPPDQCKRLKAWSRLEQNPIPVLTYVGAYLSNPASSFGHAVLTLNTNGLQKAKANDLSLDYGAGVPPNENPLMYVYRGLAGGYFASFADGNFAKHDQVYQKKELRSSWHYALDLTTDQRNLLVFHIAELMSKKKDYYFLSNNCAWGLGRAIQTALGQSLHIPNDPVWFSPMELVSILSRTQNRATGRPLVKAQTYEPSEQLVLQQILDRLSPRALKDFRRATTEQAPTTRPDGSPMTADALDAALFYWHSKNLASDNENYKVQKNRILRARLHLPPAPIYQPVIYAPPNEQPHEAPPPASVSYGLQQSRLNGTELALNLSAYSNTAADLHALGPGREMQVASIDLALGQSTNRVVAVSVLKVSSTRTRDTTGLIQGLANYAWSLQIGARRLLTEKGTEQNLRKGGIAGLDAYLEGTLGSSWTNARNTLTGKLYLGTNLNTGQNQSAYALAGGELEFRPSNHFATHLQVTLRPMYDQLNSTAGSFPNQGVQYRPLVQNQNVWALDDKGNHALKLKLWSSAIDAGAEVLLTQHF